MAFRFLLVVFASKGTVVMSTSRSKAWTFQAPIRVEQCFHCSRVMDPIPLFSQIVIRFCPQDRHVATNHILMMRIYVYICICTYIHTYFLYAYVYHM